MTNPMLAELDEVVRLAEKATPGAWDVRKDKLSGHLNVHAPDTRSHGFRVEMRIAEEVGGYCKQREDGSWDDSEAGHNADLIATAVNFLRTHAPALADMAKRLEAAERDARKPCAVLSVALGPLGGIHGQVIGADGSGEYAFVFYGDEQAAEEMAFEKVREIERSGQIVKQCVFAKGDGYCGPYIHAIDATQEGEG